jgi:hypothetical protein
MCNFYLFEVSECSQPYVVQADHLRLAGRERRLHSVRSRRLVIVLPKNLVQASFQSVILACLILASTSSTVLAQERPWTVSPCELLKRPGMYIESLVNVPGLVLYGPNQFTSHGYDCADENGTLRLEFGGNPSDPKDRFRLPQARLEDSTVPLKKDTDYDTMQRLMKSTDASGQIRMLRATLTGRFFTGQAVGNKAGEVKYPNARLVISEVELVSNKLEDPVDFSPVPRTLPKPARDCTISEVPVPSRDDEDKLQRLSREPSENLGYLNDPKAVAAQAIAAQEKIEPADVDPKLSPVGEGIALKNFMWTSADGLRSYAVAVNRPYWLLPSTYSGDTVIWTPKRITKTTCIGRR